MSFLNEEQTETKTGFGPENTFLNVARKAKAGLEKISFFPASISSRCRHRRRRRRALATRDKAL